MRNKVKVGDELFSLNVGNAARYKKKKLTAVEVIKVGRKYFTTRPIGEERDWGDKQYHLDSWSEKSNFSATSKLYASPLAYEEYNLSKELNDTIRDYFSSCYSPNLSLETLRGINALIDADDTEEE